MWWYSGRTFWLTSIHFFLDCDPSKVDDTLEQWSSWYSVCVLTLTGSQHALLGCRIASALCDSGHCLGLSSINGFGLTKIGLVLFHSWHPHEVRTLLLVFLSGASKPCGWRSPILECSQSVCYWSRCMIQLEDRNTTTPLSPIMSSTNWAEQNLSSSCWMWYRAWWAGGGKSAFCSDSQCLLVIFPARCRTKLVVMNDSLYRFCWFW